MRKGMIMCRGRRRASLAGALLLFALGCSTYQIQVPQQVGVSNHQEVAWSFAWGLAPAQPKINCLSGALVEVKVESNLAFDLLTIATLGLASPKRVSWACAPARPSEGTIELSGAGGE